MTGPPTYEAVCMTSHVGWGLAVTLVLALFMLPRRAMLIAVGLIVVKEGIIDTLVEGESLTEGLVDSCELLAGMGLALILLAMRRRLRGPLTW